MDDLKIEITRDFLDKLFRLVAWMNWTVDYTETKSFLNNLHYAIGIPFDGDALDSLEARYSAFLDEDWYDKLVTLADE